MACITIIIHLLAILLIFCTSLTFGYFIKTDSPQPEIRISQGRVRGVNMVTPRNREVFGFLGLPYAKPPIGSLRFRSPVRPDAWNGTLDASENRHPCPQLDNTFYTFFGDEDCLYLNVYAPRLPSRGESSPGENSTLLPVMMFLFGGKYLHGANNSTRWRPDFFLEKDVLLVVPAYRMGILGYLNTGDAVSPGNYALKDMVRALEWIQENIRYFGGDPGRVTLFGASSGSTSTHLLTLTNATNGLFHRYITQSGSALRTGGLQSTESCVALAVRTGKQFGCPSNTSTELVDCLREISPSKLANTNKLSSPWQTWSTIIWGPSIEPDVEGALFTDNPKNLIAAGNFHDLPWIISVDRDEGLVQTAALYTDPNLFRDILTDMDSILPTLIQYEDQVENVTAYTTSLKSYYLNDLTADKTLLLDNFTRLLGDATFIWPAYSGAKEYLTSAQSPCYLASFEYRSTLTYSFLYSNGYPVKGVAHSDELLYLIPGPTSFFGPADYNYTESDWRMVDTMVELWTSFATTGIPTTSYFNGTTTWEPFSSRENYLRIGNDYDTELELEYHFFNERLQFWKELNNATNWR